jgi:hypothetical protein
MNLVFIILLLCIINSSKILVKMNFISRLNIIKCSIPMAFEKLFIEKLGKI